MTKLKKLALFLVVSMTISLSGYAQEKDADRDKYKPMKLSLNESGSKYIRFILWNQFQYSHGLTNSEAEGFNFRRSRFLAFAQFTPRFLILFHTGTHTFNSANTDASGKTGARIFINDAWGEFMVNKQLYIGAGLHYWGAISRLQSSSTFKFLTVDNANGKTWLNYGRTGQFVREFGLYAKGTLGEKLQYTVSMNDALTNYATNNDTKVTNEVSAYGGAQLYNKIKSNKGRYNYTARLEYQILDKEGNKLPFKTGSNFGGSKKIFNVGAGMFYHPNSNFTIKEASIKTMAEIKGMVNTEKDIKNKVNMKSAFHFALDAFLDMPLGSSDMNLTAYLLYQNTNYGKNSTNAPLSGLRFTGSNITGLAGLVLPKFSEKFRLQPYFAINFLVPNIEGSNNAREIKTGANFLFVGNFAKLSMEYQNNKTNVSGAEAASLFLFQLQFFL